jgi:predicted metalloprotease with PDZ domain
MRYSIKPSNPQAHLLEVGLEIENPDPSGLALQLPGWIRGSYMIRDFARHIVSLQAKDETKLLKTIKTDKQTWRLEPPFIGTLRISYQVYAWDLSVRAAHVDTTHAYFNGPSVFLSVVGRELEHCEVEILRPDGEGYEDWKLAVTMNPMVVDEAGFGRYRVDDYETLLDHPVEMSDFTEGRFELESVPHRFVLHGRQEADLGRIGRDLAAICAEEAALFTELPVQQYLFLLWVVGRGYGGLEHKDSTSLMIDRESLPTAGMKKMTPGYRRLLALCSHEYFHLWNVKRITPEAFLQQGTGQEVYTRQLWIFEGITSYYDELILIRSGVISTKDYFEMLAEGVTRVMRGSGRHKQTLEESSFEAWTKFYKQDENAPNAIVSYYAKGALVALLLDLTLRLCTDGRSSLDDVMRELWQRYGKPGIGLPESAFEALVEEVSGLDLKDDFDHWIRSTGELELREPLRAFGIELYLLPAESADDMGGVIDAVPEEQDPRRVLGAKWQQSGKAVTLQQVFDGGAAQQAGLSAGDEIAAIDGLRMEGSQMESYLNQRGASHSVIIHAFRRDELMQFEVTPLPAPPDTCRFRLPADLEQSARERQQAWLGGHAARV